MLEPAYRKAIRDYIWREAKPPDKFSHQPRLYELACRLAQAENYDDDVLYAAAWLHDLGVFVGHRPEDPGRLAKWDHLEYIRAQAPRQLTALGFPAEKINSVLETIDTHLPSGTPKSIEGYLLRDADILEQLGAVGILRTVSKVGRDTRFIRFSDALRVLRGNLDKLPAQLKLESSKALAQPRIAVLKQFLEAAEAEAGSIEW